MPKRKLSPMEAAELGLEAPEPPPKRRTLSADEAAALGLPAGPGDLTGEDALARARQVLPHVPKKAPPKQGFWDGVTDTAEGALANYVEGAAKGGSGELMGGVSALRRVEPGMALRMPDGDVRRIKSKADWYRAGRDRTDAVREAFAEQHPTIASGLDLAGDLTSDAFLAPGKVLKAGTQALSGGLRGLLGSKADLTDGITAQDAGDVATSTGVGALGTYVAGKALNKGGAWLGKKLDGSRLMNWLQSKSRNAAADAAEQETRKAMKGLRVNNAHLGGAASATMTDVATAREVLSDPLSKPEHLAWAKEFLESPATRTAIDRARENTTQLAPQRMGRMITAEAARDTAAKAATPEAIDRAAEETLSRPLDPLKKAAWKYGTRAVPLAVMSYVGNEVGGGPGSIVGGLAGMATGAVLGDPGTAMKNIVNHPGVRRAFWNGMQRGPRGLAELAEKYGPVITKRVIEAMQGGGGEPEEAPSLMPVDPGVEQQGAYANALRKGGQ